MKIFTSNIILAAVLLQVISATEPPTTTPPPTSTVKPQTTPQSPISGSTACMVDGEVYGYCSIGLDGAWSFENGAVCIMEIECIKNRRLYYQQFHQLLL